MVGYAGDLHSTSDTYYMYTPRTNKVVTTKDVRWEEWHVDKSDTSHLFDEQPANADPNREEDAPKGFILKDKYNSDEMDPGMPGLINSQNLSDSKIDDKMPGQINCQVPIDSDSDNEYESDDLHPRPRCTFNQNNISDDGAQGNNSDEYLSFGSKSDQDVSYKNKSRANTGNYRAAKYHEDIEVRQERTRSQYQHNQGCDEESDKESDEDSEEESDNAEFEVNLELEVPAAAIPRLHELGKEANRQHLTQQLDERLYTALRVLSSDPNTPSSWKEMWNDPKNRSDWAQSTVKDIINFMSRDVWEKKKRSELLQGRKPIKVKWIFKIKHEHDGTIQLTSRIVVKWYSQIPRTDYSETFSPVANDSSIRIILTITLTKKDWEFNVMDIEAAFLEADLDEDAYIEWPEGLKEEMGFTTK